MPDELALAGAEHNDGLTQKARREGSRTRAKPPSFEFYDQDKGGQVQHAEAFEICEYGSRPNKAELKKLFPCFGE